VVEGRDGARRGFLGVVHAQDRGRYGDAEGNRAEVAAWSLVSLMLLVCGIYYPVSILPQWGTAIAALIPLTYFLEYFRHFYGFAPIFSHVLFTGTISRLIRSPPRSSSQRIGLAISRLARTATEKFFFPEFSKEKLFITIFG
jgi:hypothetical protein